MLYRGTRKRPASAAPRLQHCLWFVLLLLIAGVSLFLASKFFDDDTASKLLQLKTDRTRGTAPGYFVPPVVDRSSKVEAPLGHLSSEESEISSLDASRAVLGITSRPSFDEIHFIHIPKCGGTTMTTILRQMVCNLNPAKNADCCLNPGFCDWHAFRRCAMIKGCINHFPNRKLIYKDLPSMAVFREPTSRLISAFYYRGHSPNLDFFQVRPEFKEISQGRRPKVAFDEYIEMVEYQNIFTRMLGADSFPYRNITITDEVFRKAIDAVDRLYFVALQEDFDVSVQALGRLMRVPNSTAISITKERGGESKSITQQKSGLRSNVALMERVRQVNHYDIKLFDHVVKRYCAIIAAFPDLMSQLRQRGKVHCA